MSSSGWYAQDAPPASSTSSSDDSSLHRMKHWTRAQVNQALGAASPERRRFIKDYVKAVRVVNLPGRFLHRGRTKITNIQSSIHTAATTTAERLRSILDGHGLDGLRSSVTPFNNLPIVTAQDNINVTGTGIHLDTSNVYASVVGVTDTLVLDDDEQAVDEHPAELPNNAFAGETPEFQQITDAAVVDAVAPPGDSASPSRPAPLFGDLVQDTSKIQHAWEENVIPEARKILPLHSSLHLFSGANQGEQTVLLTTPAALSGDEQLSFASKLLNQLPEQFRATTTFHHVQSHIVRSQDPSRDHPICPPKNGCGHQSPMAGDSIGTLQGPDTSATLGLQLQIGSKGYNIINCHAIGDVLERGRKTLPWKDTSDIVLLHPSTADHSFCKEHHPSCTTSQSPTRLGHLVDHSGEPNKTVRLSNRILGPERPFNVVTDNATFEAPNLAINSVRGITTPIVRSAPVVPGQRVKAIGRTSGLTTGRLGLAPALVRSGNWNRLDVPIGNDTYSTWHPGNLTPVDTREWAIQFDPASSYYDAELWRWVVAGAGKPGDSGSPVLNENHEALGTVWGRNVLADSEALNRTTGVSTNIMFHPIAYFSLFNDICDDIESRMGSRPILPTEQSIRAARTVGAYTAPPRPTAAPRRTSATCSQRTTNSAEVAEYVKNMTLSIAGSFTEKTTSPLAIAA